MRNIDSEKLIEQIEEAKDWLEKAKDEYSKANPVRGGLILNLAQAEVKHAWELSHHQFVSKSVYRIRGKHYTKYWLPVAASIVLFISLFIGTQMGKKILNPELTSVKEPSGKIAGNEVYPVKKINSKTQSHSSVVNNQESAPKNSEDLLKDIPKKDIQFAANKPVNSIKMEAEPQPEHKKQDVISVKSSIKPVSQLQIDEEALTKEASHSLRNGK